MKLGAYTVTITVDDEPLAEYKTEVDGARTECWIASEEGKAFRILLEQDAGWTTFATLADVFLDGSLKPAVRPLLDEDSNSRLVKGSREAANTIRPFLFLPIVTTDHLDSDSSVASDGLGSIILRFWRVKRLAVSETPKWVAVPDTSNFSEISVKKRKVSHSCGFGESTLVPKVAMWNVRCHDPLEKPLHTFIFKYRSRSLLQAMEIIDNSPPPASPTRDTPVRNASAGPSRPAAIAPAPAVEADVEMESDVDDDDVVKFAQAALDQAKAQARAKRALLKAAQSQDVKPKAAVPAPAPTAVDKGKEEEKAKPAPKGKGRKRERSG